ncbi:MAG: GDP-L-fucose synthase [Verrucomicrobia bacterium]|nr:GDP-L-fucose synthase [Verrucomicrobiota bacterium]MBS0647043.1 GDP-L-fucose synthase [Verrucomicrobiota bacterium]
MENSLHPDQVILVTGGQGMVGSAIIRCLLKNGYKYLLTPSRQELDCTRQQDVECYLAQHRPDVVIIAAAKVGGILANSTFPAEFLYQNMLIAANLIHGAHIADVSRLLFLGSTCIYPRDADQPIKEESLLTAPLEQTNEAYALAKICGIQLCKHYQQQYGRDYISAMPTNLYGPGDRYHSQYSHVIPSLMLRFHEAKMLNLPSVSVWGTGKVWREFLYVEDLAEACLFLLRYYHGTLHVNVGSQEEVTIAQLAQVIAQTVGYCGHIEQDSSKPDGTPRKKSDTTRLTQLGWSATTSLQEGLKVAYQDFLERIAVTDQACAKCP